MQSKLKDDIDVRFKGNRIIMYTKSMEDYDVLEKEIKDSYVEYHTYTKNECKQIKMVIKGLPPMFHAMKLLRISLIRT